MKQPPWPKRSVSRFATIADKRTKVALAGTPHPQTLDVVRTRAEPLGIEIDGETIDDNTAALLVSWPDTFGVYGDHKAAIDRAHATGAIVVFIADPLGLTLTDAPAKLGADIAVGPMQRFGVPMGFGGPHAAYCAVSDKLTRLMPGRLVGQSTDSKGRPGYRLALQTREQHIRRDKATPTSAPHRRCSPTWRPPMPSGTAPPGCRRLPGASMRWPIAWQAASWRQACR